VGAAPRTTRPGTRQSRRQPRACLTVSSQGASTPLPVAMRTPLARPDSPGTAAMVPESGSYLFVSSQRILA
jgi:hypothetical protein